MFPVLSAEEKNGKEVQSLGKSRKAATLAVGETALSRVFNSTPIMVLPALVLVRMQRTEWLKRRPRLTLPLNLGIAFILLLGSLLTMDGRTDSHNVDFRATACVGRLSAEAGCGCEEAGGVFLGEGRQGWGGGVQSRHLDVPGPQATNALHILRAAYHNNLRRQLLLLPPKPRSRSEGATIYHTWWVLSSLYLRSSATSNRPLHRSCLLKLRPPCTFIPRSTSS